jgi:dUTP pyrophosphatase
LLGAVMLHGSRYSAARKDPATHLSVGRTAISGAGSTAVLRTVRNPALDPPLVEALVDLWTEVSNAGGAVGFLPPVARDEVRAVADSAFERVTRGIDDLAVTWHDGEPVGLGFLCANEWPLYRHWALIRRLQRHPERRGLGIGSALLTELEAAAHDRSYERLVLTVRGGTGREGFYLAHGFSIEARLPRRIRIADDDVREELVMSKDLSGAPAPAFTLPLHVQRLDPELPLPAYAHAGDAGLDLHAREHVELAPGERAVVPTGVAVAIPEGCVGLVHPRSGLAARHGLGLVNAPGTIDAGYRGEIKVVVVNHDPAATIHLRRGDRIAQLVVQRVEVMQIVEVDALPGTSRGDGGFGSSGR